MKMITAFRTERIRKYIQSYYFRYSVFFLLLFGTAFFSFFAKGKTVIWRTDGFTQHYPALLYLKMWAEQLLSNLKSGNFEIPMWDMKLGEGSDFLTVFSFRPLYLISLFWKRENLESFFWFRLFVSMYASGMSFTCFCGKWKEKDDAMLFASLLYVYSGYILCYAFKHAFFIEASVCFPLLLAGAEKLLRKESPALFLTTVCYLAVSYFYLLYMLSLFCGMYVLIRFFYTDPDRSVRHCLRLLGKFASAYLCGLGLAGFSLLPNLLLVLESGRTGDVSGRTIPLFYDLKYYITLFTSVSGIESVGEYGYCLVSALALLLVMKLCVEKGGHRQRQFQIAGLAGLVLCCFPAGAALANGMAAVTNRWFFVLAFGGALVVAFEFPSIKKMDGSTFVRLYLVVQVYVILCLCLHFLFGTGVYFVSFLFLYLMLAYLEMKYRICASVWGKWIFGFVFILEIGVNAYSFYNLNEENIIGQYLDAGELEQLTKENAADAVKDIQDESVYRTDAVEGNALAPYLNRNYGLRNHCNGISTYFSYAPADLLRTVKELGVSQRFNDFAISSYDQRTALDTLSCVKYLTAGDKKNRYVPYGFEKVKKSGNHLIYENKNALPLFYAYGQVIPKDVYDQLSVNEKEQAMLQGAVTDSSFVPACRPVFCDSVVASHQEVFRRMQRQIGKQCDPDHGAVRVEKGQTTVRIRLPEHSSGELYIRLEDAAYEDIALADYLSDGPGIRSYLKDVRSVSGHFGVIRAGMDGISKTAYILGKGQQYYKGVNDYLINLGYVEGGQDVVTLCFRNNGTFRFSGLSVIVQPMDPYAAQVKALQADVSEIAVKGNTIRGCVRLEEKKILCIAVPYLKGWKAYVDGEACEIRVVNGRYMGLELTEGEHCVRLHYETPGLKAGALISIVFTICIVFHGTGALPVVLAGGSRKRKRGVP